MANTPKTPDKTVQEQIPEVKLGDCHILILDASSSCTGYAILKTDFVNKKASLTKAGCVWFDDNWGHGRKYDYMYTMLQDHFWIVEQIDHIIAEQYSINTKKMSGALVSPELHGVIKAAAYSNGVEVSLMLPQTWRAQLGIKPVITGTGKKKKKDYKTPTAEIVTKTVNLPVKIISNITKNERQLPNDVTDAIAIAIAWAKKNGITITDTNCTFNDYVGA